MFDPDENGGCGGGLGVSLKRKGVMCDCLFCSFTLWMKCEC